MMKSSMGGYINTVFVYGTLKRGQGNHGILHNKSEFVAHARIGNEFTAYSKGIGYPFMAEVAGIGCVGEVYQVNDEVLANLDRLEGHPGYYERKVRPVVCGDGTEVLAWVYLMGNEVPAGVDIIEEW